MKPGEQAQEHDTTAEVVVVEKEFAGISSEISTKLLWFDKEKLFVFGVRFDGELDKVLEEKMKVNVHYRFAHPQHLPIILAVWLGDEKPESLNKRFTLGLKPIYGQSGHVIGEFDDGSYLLSPSDCTGQSIIIDKSSIFRDGSRIKPEDAVLFGNELLVFDAAPLSLKHDPSGAQYEATCAWVGQEPLIVDRFASPGDPDCCALEGSTTKIASGRVVCLLNESVALVDIESGRGVRSAFLFRSSFDETGCNKPIHKLTRVGDGLVVQLQVGYISSERKVWFVVRVLEHVKNAACPAVSVPKRTSSQSVETGEFRAVKKVRTNESETQTTVLDSDNSGPIAQTSEPSLHILQGEEVWEYEPFTRSKRGFKPLLQKLTAKLVFKDVGGVRDLGIERRNVFSSVLGRVIFGMNEDKPINSEVMNRFVGRTVRFDAETSRRRLHVERIWSGDTGIGRPSKQRFLKDQLACESGKCFPMKTPFKGKIVSIPSYSSAIAAVDNVRVLVPISSMNIVADANDTTTKVSCIREYLSVGTDVCVVIRKRGGKKEKYYQSVETWLLKKGRKNKKNKPKQDEVTVQKPATTRKLEKQKSKKKSKGKKGKNPNIKKRKQKPKRKTRLEQINGV